MSNAMDALDVAMWNVAYARFFHNEAHEALLAAQQQEPTGGTNFEAAQKAWYELMMAQKALDEMVAEILHDNVAELIKNPPRRGGA